MKALRRFFLRLTAPVARGRDERRLRDEIEEHLALQTAENIQCGMSPDEARRQAVLKFGAVEAIKEDYRDRQGLPFLDHLVTDVRHALRSLRKSPGFTAVAVITLALGIGANTAIFSLVDRLLVRPLPVRNPEQLVVVADPSSNRPQPFMWNHHMWSEIQRRPELFDGTLGYFYSRFNLASGGETNFVSGLYVSGGFFETLGVPASVGRTLTHADDVRRGSSDGPATVISHSFWQRKFGGDLGIIGQSIRVQRVPLTIVGVLPQGFVGPLPGRAFDVAVPVELAALLIRPEFVEGRGVNWITIMARLKPGQTIDAAASALHAVQPDIREASLPDAPPAITDAYLTQPLALLPATSGNPLAPLRVRAERPLLMMQIVVGLVLAIACVNIANLMLARTLTQQHESSVRLALGASRWTLARRPLVESLLLAGIGAAGGFLLAQWGTSLLVHLLPVGSNPITVPLGPDGRVLVFTAAIAVATTVLFGIIPARRASHTRPVEFLKAHAVDLRGGRSPLAGGLLVVQVALALMLVFSGGLLLQTFSNLASKDLGFDPSGILIADVELSEADIPPAHRLAVFEQVRHAVAAVPGVETAAIADNSPVAGGYFVSDVEVVGARSARPQGEAFFNRVSPGWLPLYRTSILAGRDFTEADRTGARNVAIVNEAFAHDFLGGASPIGRIVRNLHAPPGRAPLEWEIIGMTADAVYQSVRASAPPTVYAAFDQIDQHALNRGMAPSYASLSFRAAAGSPTALMRTVGAAISGVNPNLDFTFRQLPEVVSGSIAVERSLAVLTTVFGALALVLAAVGLYGVTSYATNRRRMEIGIRIALGATSGGVVWQVVSGIAGLVGIGIVVGGVASLWASKFLASLLYEVQPRDFTTLVSAVVALIAAGILAGYLPARRAAHVDPLVALRYE
jgi:putative ABC transport system permease protein